MDDAAVPCRHAAKQHVHQQGWHAPVWVVILGERAILKALDRGIVILRLDMLPHADEPQAQAQQLDVARHLADC